MSKAATEVQTHQAEQLATALKQLARMLNHPKTMEFINRQSGTQLDKVSEITMTCLNGPAELRMSEIASRLGVELSSVSRKVAKLEEAELIERKPDPDDARASRMFLTDRGEQLLALREAARNTQTELVVADWTAADKEQFSVLLNRFITDLATHIGAP